MKLIRNIISLIILNFIISSCTIGLFSSTPNHPDFILPTKTNSGTFTGALEIALANIGSYYSSGVSAKEGRTLKIMPYLGEIKIPSKKYRVIYKVDPRFIAPVVYVMEYIDGEYRYADIFQNNSNNTITRDRKRNILSFVEEEFNKILIKNGDVVSITMVDKEITSSISRDLDIGCISVDDLCTNFRSISDNYDNVIYQYSESKICELSPSLCSNSKITNENFIKNYYIGGILISPDIIPRNPISKNSASNIIYPDKYFDNGEGVIFSVSDNIIKPSSLPLLQNPYSRKKQFLFIAENDGRLYFSSDETDFSTSNIFRNFEYQFAPQWPVDLNKKILLDNVGRSEINNILIGRYVFDVEVTHASLDAADVPNLRNNIKFIAKIGDVEKEFDLNGLRIESPSDGEVSISISRNSNIADHLKNGKVYFQVSAYTGSVIISNFLQDIVDGISYQFLQASVKVFGMIVTNTKFKIFVYTILTLYIFIFGVLILIGKSSSMTIKQYATSGLKFTLVSLIMTNEATLYFSRDIYNIFLILWKNLALIFTGETSNPNNIFGFIDPILETYLDNKLWMLLAVYLFNWINGFVLVGICLISGIIAILFVMLTTILSYMLALVVFSVLSVLLPFIVCALLFERTKSIFDNWLTLLFSVVFEPAVKIFLLLFLLNITTDLFYSSLLEVTPRGFNWDINTTIFGKDIRITILSLYFYLAYSQPGDFETAITSGLLFCAMSSIIGAASFFSESIVKTIIGAPSPGSSTANKASTNIGSNITSGFGKAVGKITGNRGVILGLAKAASYNTDKAKKFINDKYNKKSIEEEKNKNIEKTREQLTENYSALAQVNKKLENIDRMDHQEIVQLKNKKKDLQNKISWSEKDLLKKEGRFTNFDFKIKKTHFGSESIRSAKQLASQDSEEVKKAKEKYSSTEEKFYTEKKRLTNEYSLKGKDIPEEENNKLEALKIQKIKDKKEMKKLGFSDRAISTIRDNAKSKTMDDIVKNDKDGKYYQELRQASKDCKIKKTELEQKIKLHTKKLKIDKQRSILEHSEPLPKKSSLDKIKEKLSKKKTFTDPTQPSTSEEIELNAMRMELKNTIERSRNLNEIIWSYQDSKEKLRAQRDIVSFQSKIAKPKGDSEAQGDKKFGGGTQARKTARSEGATQAERSIPSDAAESTTPDGATRTEGATQAQTQESGTTAPDGAGATSEAEPARPETGEQTEGAAQAQAEVGGDNQVQGEQAQTERPEGAASGEASPSTTSSSASDPTSVKSPDDPLEARAKISGVDSTDSHEPVINDDKQGDDIRFQNAPQDDDTTSSDSATSPPNTDSDKPKDD